MSTGWVMSKGVYNRKFNHLGKFKAILKKMIHINTPPPTFKMLPTVSGCL